MRTRMLGVCTALALVGVLRRRGGPDGAAGIGRVGCADRDRYGSRDQGSRRHSTQGGGGAQELDAIDAPAWGDPDLRGVWHLATIRRSSVLSNLVRRRSTPTKKR